MQTSFKNNMSGTGKLLIFLIMPFILLGFSCSPSLTITARDIDAPWPLRVDKVIAKREGFALYVLHDGQKYALNGPALKNPSARYIGEITFPSEDRIGYQYSMISLFRKAAELTRSNDFPIE
ncbi:MAG: hypothetical protein ACR2PT_07410 [Endozoicomonas sp.]